MYFSVFLSSILFDWHLLSFKCKISFVCACVCVHVCLCCSVVVLDHLPFAMIQCDLFPGSILEGSFGCIPNHLCGCCTDVCKEKGKLKNTINSKMVLKLGA